MNQSILFITPPFTQLNTSYPATACLKGFMNTREVISWQCDLGIGVILEVFSEEGLQGMFGEAGRRMGSPAGNIRRMLQMQDRYVGTIGPVIGFLQGRNPELAHLVCGRQWLPEASRFKQITDLDRDFGHLGIHDRAKHLATLYLEDIADFITEVIDPHFGFSRYAERLGRSASSFDELQQALDHPGSFIDGVLTRLLEEKVERHQPTLVALSVPFPGNLYSALKCGQWIKNNHPGVQVAMGGGFVNTELRSLADPRVFDYVDFITLDDGEVPLLCLTEYLNGTRSLENLKRTFVRVDGTVAFFDGSKEADAAPHETGTPDYSGLQTDKYLSVFEVANPMHRLWSDGRWNKLMLAHGCYWGKCTFCDVTLDYIKRYEPNRPSLICDRMEAIMAQTGNHGFHFTDEAAPPTLLRDLALEILRRKITVVWWTNIRFEKNFTRDLCMLLRTSGCIAVSGGLEVASDRILKMISKGVTVSQVARVAGNFTGAGIMVHAYLMYGFPTQTARETIDSLEVVRQLFEEGVVQSGFWHQFAMTAHSPVGLEPQRFGIEKEETPPGTFANNDLIPIDHKGCDHAAFSQGLKKSLYNYMHGICFEYPLEEWFDFRVPHTTVDRFFIRDILARDPYYVSAYYVPPESSVIPPGKPEPHSRVIWLGAIPAISFYTRIKKGKSSPAARITIQAPQKEVAIPASEAVGRWLMGIFSLLVPGKHDPVTFRQLEESYQANRMGDFAAFWNGPVAGALTKSGCLVTV